MEGGINLFAYVRNSPASYIDPKGLWFEGVFGNNYSWNFGRGGVLQHIADNILSPNGLHISAELLTNSLKDNPNSYWNYTGATDKIINSPEFIFAIANLAPGDYNNFYVNVVFQADKDLKLALHDVDVYVTGKKGDPCKQGSKDNLQIHIHDDYNFHYGFDYGDITASLAANYARISQDIGIVHPFPIDIYFSYPQRRK